MKSITFIAWLVMRIIPGHKTQTRRIISHLLDNRGPRWGPQGWEDWHGKKIRCPYKEGDRLCVREEHYLYGQWIVKGKTKTGRDKQIFVRSLYNREVKFSDNPPPNWVPNSFMGGLAWYKRISRFMPSRASRITLEIVNVRPERILDISEADALAEGIEDRGPLGLSAFGIDRSETARDAFFYLWTKVHGPGSLDHNPWVWVFEFKVIEVKKETIFL